MHPRPLPRPLGTTVAPPACEQGAGPRTCQCVPGRHNGVSPCEHRLGELHRAAPCPCRTDGPPAGTKCLRRTTRPEHGELHLRGTSTVREPHRTVATSLSTARYTPGCIQKLRPPLLAEGATLDSCSLANGRRGGAATRQRQQCRPPGTPDGTVRGRHLRWAPWSSHDEEHFPSRTTGIHLAASTMATEKQ